MTNKLSLLRDQMRARGLAAYLVPRADEHLGEYVPPSAERLAWLTGFTGSAGLAVVMEERAALFVDGRYTLQAAEETDAAIWEQHHLIEHPPAKVLAEVLPEGAVVGCDPMLFSADALRKYEEAGLKLARLDQNLVDAVWTGRPAPPMDEAIIQPLRYAGLSSSEKRQEIAEALTAAKEDAAILTDPASICWLLNIRGRDVGFTPIALAFALVHADASVEVFAEPAKFPADVRTWLGNQVSVHARGEMRPILASLAGRKVRVDPAASPAWFADYLTESGAHVSAAPDPCALPKACKNETEQTGARAAHLFDAIALAKFLHWLSTTPGQTELSAAAKLVAFRAESPDFQGESFPAISAAGPHGSIVHYRVSETSDRAIEPGDVYLIDSGGQYLSGTTDVTRTLWIGDAPPPDEVRADYTRVLQGHLALGSIQFPEGLAGPFLDTLARAPLWRAGLDYDHGTGHGVGSYLSVHEGPAGISRAAKPIPLAAGMILSNEPGYYPGPYGIRIENLVLVRPVETPRRKFLGFETLTLAPYDRRLIDTDMLSAAEIALVDAYHARVYQEVSPHLQDKTRIFLEEVCGKLK